MFNIPCFVNLFKLLQGVISNKVRIQRCYKALLHVNFNIYNIRRQLKQPLTEWYKNYFFTFIIPCIVIFYGMTNRCNNVQ